MTVPGGERESGGCAESKDAGALVKIVLDWKVSLWIMNSATEIISKYQTGRIYEPASKA